MAGVVDMQVILEHDEQPECLDQGFASCGLYKLPTLILKTHCPCLHTIRNTCSDGRQQSCNAKNLTCTKNHSNTKTANSFSFTMVAASKLPAYRPAGARSGQRRPNESFSEQIERITKARMASRDAPVATSAKAVPKTPPKSAGNVAPTTPPKAVGAKLMPTPPMEPPPWYAPAAPKAKVFIRPAVPRPPPAKKAAAPYPPPAAPKDAAVPGGYSGPGPKFPARPRPPTPPARPSRAPHVVDVDNIPEIPEAASGSASSGTAELPKATVGEPRRQIKLKELFIISRGTRPEAVQLTRRPPELQDPNWDTILKSLHKVDNPQRDKTLQSHIGISRTMILQLVQLPSMREAVLKAASQALHSERAIVIFECSQGRHRSVAAAGILYQILQPLIPRMKLLHASSKNWKGACGGQCPECKRGPSQEFHDEVDVLRNALLAQLERDYMEPPAPAFVDNNQIKQRCKIPARQVPGYGCRAIQQLLDCLQVCPSFSIKVAPTLVDQALPAGYDLGFFDLKLSSKNQQKQQIVHTSKNQIENQQHKIGRKFLECYRAYKICNLLCLSFKMLANISASANPGRCVWPYVEDGYLTLFQAMASNPRLSLGC